MAGNSVFLARNPRFQFFFWLPKRVNRDISCIATKVRKLQIYPFSFQHTRLEYRPPLASKIQMEIHDTHIYVEHIYICILYVAWTYLNFFLILSEYKQFSIYLFSLPSSFSMAFLSSTFSSFSCFVFLAPRLFLARNPVAQIYRISSVNCRFTHFYFSTQD